MMILEPLNGPITDYIDMDSFVDFFIINEVCRNVDGYRAEHLYPQGQGW